MASVDAIKIALERIEKRCGDPRLKFLGVDQDLKLLAEALQQIQFREREIAYALYCMCGLLSEAEGLDGIGKKLLRAIDRNALVVWQSNLREIAKS